MSCRRCLKHLESISWSKYITTVLIGIHISITQVLLTLTPPLLSSWPARLIISICTNTNLLAKSFLDLVTYRFDMNKRAQTTFEETFLSVFRFWYDTLPVRWASWSTSHGFRLFRQHCHRFHDHHASQCFYSHSFLNSRLASRVSCSVSVPFHFM